MVAHKDGAAVKLVSRQGIDHTRRYQDVVAAIRALEVPTLILDGEIAIFDQKLISRFEWLRHSSPPVCDPAALHGVRLPVLPRKGPPRSTALRPPERDRGRTGRPGPGAASSPPC